MQLDLDLKELCAQPRFRRFLLHIVRIGGIFSPSTGAIENLQFREGQRSLVMDILREASRGLPRGASAEQMLALLLTETSPKETDDDDTDRTESELTRSDAD